MVRIKEYELKKLVKIRSVVRFSGYFM